MNITKPLPKALPKPSCERKTLMFSELLNVIEADKSLSRVRQRDVRSAFRAVGRVLDKDPNRIPAKWAILHKPLGCVQPAQFGYSRKRWQNIISDVRFAIHHADAEPCPVTRTDLSVAWKKIWGQLDHPGMRRGLSRFVRFCDGSGIPPHRVDDKVSEKYLLYIEEHSTTKEPLVTHRRACAMWNKAVTTTAGWPQMRLTVPSYRTASWVLKPEDFLESFRDDVESYLKWLSGGDFLTRTPPIEPCKPSTIRLQRRQLYRIASAAALNGYDVRNLTTLNCFSERAFVQCLVGHYQNQSDTKPSKYVHDLFKFLITVTRRWIEIDEETEKWFDSLLQRWNSSPVGMTEKNRGTLRLFHSEDNVAKILALPERLMARALRSKASPRRVAVTVQKALAIELLLMAPMRVGNLASLRTDQHVVRPGGHKGPVHLVLEDYEVKNDIPLEFELPQQTARLLETYLVKHRIHLAEEDSPWLFPGAKGGSKRAQTLSEQLSEITERETGLRLTAHQFRHFAAKIFLDREPGNYEMVRRLLGHKSIRTTTQYYTGMETLTATRRYDSIISEKRGDDREKINAR